MKKIILAALVSAVTCSSFAAETTTLKVKGTITNAACTPTLSNGGTVDFGTIRTGGLSTTEFNQLGKKNINLDITCDSPTKVGFFTLDNRVDSIASITIENGTTDGSPVSQNSNMFGLGKTAEDVSIGAYAISVDPVNLTADGNAGKLLKLEGGSEVWQESTTGTTQNGSGTFTRTFTIGDESLAPIAYTQASYPLIITAAIDSTEKLAITDDTQLDGDTTITLVYL